MNAREHISETRQAELAAGLAVPTAQELAHLEACQTCAREVQSLKEDLRAFGRMAQERAPASSATVHLPAASPGRLSSPLRRRARQDPVIRRQRMFAGFALAAAAAAFMLTLLGRPYDTEPLHMAHNKPVTQQHLQAGLDQDAHFIAQVKQLEQNPLPSMVTDLIGDVDNSLDDEEFILFMDSEEGDVYMKAVTS